MKVLPSNLKQSRRTPEFTELSIPSGLLKAHQTKAGTWGKIVILEGELLYRILAPELEEVMLSASNYGVVEPTVLHEVSAPGKVKFYVQFYE